MKNFSNNNRINKVRKLLIKNNIDAAVISSVPNITYLTSFAAENSAVVITQNEIKFFVSPCYYEEAKTKNIPYLDITKLTAFNKELITYLQKFSSIGYEINITYEDYANFNKLLKGKKLVAVKELNRLREIKEEEEINLLREAAEITTNALNYILNFIKEGIYELDLKIELEYFIKKQYYTELSFDTIVASGNNSSFPHYKSTTKKIKLGEFILFDFGIKYRNYCSDISRTFILGKPTAQQKEIYNTVYDVQNLAIEKMKEGEVISQIFRYITNSLKQKNYNKFFIHNLGHGIGLEVHEGPTLSRSNRSKLKENMVVTVEPGIYITNLGGVRIEDVVIIKKDNNEVLTKFDKRLIEL